MSNWTIVLYLIIVAMIATAAAAYMRSKADGLIPAVSRTRFRYAVVYEKDGSLKNLQKDFFHMGRGDRFRFGFGSCSDWGNQVSFEKIFGRTENLELSEQREMMRTVEDLGYSCMFELVDKNGALKIRTAREQGQIRKDIYYFKEDERLRLSDRETDFDDVSEITGENTQTVVLDVPGTPLKIYVVRYV